MIIPKNKLSHIKTEYWHLLRNLSKKDPEKCILFGKTNSIATVFYWGLSLAMAHLGRKISQIVVLRAFNHFLYTKVVLQEYLG